MLRAEEDDGFLRINGQVEPVSGLLDRVGTARDDDAGPLGSGERRRGFTGQDHQLVGNGADLPLDPRAVMLSSQSCIPFQHLHDSV